MSQAPAAISKRNQRFQAVKENPSFFDCTVNIRPQYLLYTVAWTSLSAGAGWIYGYPRRKFSAIAAGTLSLIAGIGLCQQDTFLRLKGFRENSRELALFGVQQRELVKITKKRPQNLAETQEESA